MLERAVRMVLEHEAEHTSQWAAITSIASKFGMTPETLRIWVRRAGFCQISDHDSHASVALMGDAGEDRW